MVKTGIDPHIELMSGNVIFERFYFRLDIRRTTIMLVTKFM